MSEIRDELRADATLNITETPINDITFIIQHSTPAIVDVVLKVAKQIGSLVRENEILREKLARLIIDRSALERYRQLDAAGGVSND